MALPEHDNGKGVVIIYATCPDQDTALDIAKRCVDARLAACVNVFGAMTSVFRWDGAIEMAAECSLIAKTTATHADALVAEIIAAHPYDVPAVIVVPVAGGHVPFLDWVTESVAKDTD